VTRQNAADPVRAQWYAQHRARRLRFQITGPLRESHYDRRCPLCGVGLGGFDRYVFTPQNDTYFSVRERAERHMCMEAERPPRIVVCPQCGRLYRNEFVERYAARNAARERKAA